MLLRMRQPGEVDESSRVDVNAEPSAGDLATDESRRSGPRRLVAGLMIAVAAVPVVRMALLVRGVSRMQYGDYWLIFGDLIGENGSLQVENLLVRHNGHPLLTAKLIYWLNLTVFEGSNRSMAAVVVVVGVAQVAILGWMLMRTPISVVERGVLLVLSSALLFSMNGAWNYVLSMSGAAWLTANVWALGALLARWQQRWLLAVPLAVLATLSYGTGMAVWPALIAVGLVCRPWRQWWKEMPLAAALVGFEVLRRMQSTSVLTVATTVGGFLRDLPAMVAWPFGLTGPPAVVVGATALAAVAALGLWAVVGNHHESAPWLGVAVYGIVATAFIVYGRPGEMGAGEGRYQSLPSFVWIGLAAMVVLRVRHRAMELVASRAVSVRRVALWGTSVVVVMPMVVAATVAGSGQRRMMEETRDQQDLGAIALRLGLDRDLNYMTRVGSSPVDVDHLESADQYPLTRSWNADCGLLGTRLDLSKLDRAGGGLSNLAESTQLEGGVELMGRVPPGVSISCVVITDDRGEVVGLGLDDLWLNRAFPVTDGSRRIRAVARTGVDRYRAVVVTPSGRRVLLDGSIAPAN